MPTQSYSILGDCKITKMQRQGEGKSPLYGGFNKRTRMKMQVRRLLTTINPKTGGQGRNRTAVPGFADPYLAARPPDPSICPNKGQVFSWIQR
jgi:hypothetical protein